MHEVKKELYITGKDEVEIDLDGEPEEVLVYFDAHFCPTPCDPKHDKCDWKHHHDKQKNKHKLKISWDVAGVKCLSWKVKYKS